MTGVLRWERHVDFNSTSAQWAKMSKAERLALCERYALEADRLGHKAMAADWRKLAKEIDVSGSAVDHRKP